MKKVACGVIPVCLFLLPQLLVAEGYTMAPDDDYILNDPSTLSVDGLYLGGSSYKMVGDESHAIDDGYAMKAEDGVIGGGSYNMTPDWGNVGNGGYPVSSYRKPIDK